MPLLALGQGFEDLDQRQAGAKQGCELVREEREVETAGAIAAGGDAERQTTAR